MDRKSKAEALLGRTTRHFHTGDLETREADGLLQFRGYGSTTEQSYDMGWYSETVKNGAFRSTLTQNPDVVLVLNHGDSGHGLPLARTTNGSLQLAEDDTGLRWEAQVDAEDPDARIAARKVDQGLLNQCSFAFRIVRQSWDEDYTQRDILEVNLHRGDVSIVNNGANPNTPVSMVRAADYCAALLEVRAGKALSGATMDVLTKVLGWVSDADDGVDQAQIALSALMGVDNPDDDSQWQQNSQPESNLELYRARALALRLAAA